MSSVDPNDFDKSVRPADDFYRYVNGGWLAKNPIPPDESRWGSFYTLRFEVEQQVRKLLDEIVDKTDLAPGSDEQKVRDFYREAMDMEKRNRLGIAPLLPYFKEIDGVTTINDLARVVGELHRAGISVFWNTFVGQDEKQSEVMALQFWQGGLGLPDRDYYLIDDEKNKKIRADYLVYMADMLTNANIITEKAPGELLVSDAAKDRITSSIFDIEMRLATASLTRVELRDVEKMYNKMTLAAFALIAPKVPLADYFPAVAPADPSFQPAYLIVGQPKFFAEVNEIFENVAMDDIKLYLRWQLLNGAANYLSEDLERRNFEFYGRTFGGAKEMKALWRRALRATDSALDELLGKVYVARYFSEGAKQKVKDLVEHLAVAYRTRIEKLDWMSEETKKKALEKLGTVSKKLAYPDVWKDYSTLTIGTDSFLENALRAQMCEFDRKIKEVGGPVNRNEWLMPPQLVNAYYMPPMNEIAFPAAILQPPFFDPAADDAVNFGGIGSVIGHELTHGFDDQGSLFDAKGNLSRWWTEADKEKFDAKAAHLAEQFDNYEPLPDIHINGKLTLGENIADLGGIIIAYDALKLRLEERAVADPAALEKIDGFTPEQRFFMGYAVTERGHDREEVMRLQLQTDPHSPGEFRVNGPMSNLDEFYAAFDVKEGDKLWRKPEERVKIW